MNHKTEIWYNKAEGGFTILLSLLVAGVVAAAIVVSLLLLGIGSSRIGFAYEQEHQAMALADACAEEALQVIRDSSACASSGSLSLGQGTCGYIVAGSLSQCIVTASGTISTTVRKITIVTSVF